MRAVDEGSSKPKRSETYVFILPDGMDDLYFCACDNNSTRARWIFKPFCLSRHAETCAQGSVFWPKYHITTVVSPIGPGQDAGFWTLRSAIAFTKHANAGKNNTVECIFLHLDFLQKEHGWELQLRLPSIILKQYALLLLREAIREEQMDLTNLNRERWCWCQT